MPFPDSTTVPTLNVGFYVLDEHGDPRPEPDATAWATWFEASTEKRTVGIETIGEHAVSTMFVGIPMGFDRNRPSLYLTVVSGGDLDGFCQHYPTSRAATFFHGVIVDAIRQGTTLRHELQGEVFCAAMDIADELRERSMG